MSLKDPGSSPGSFFFSPPNAPVLGDGAGLLGFHNNFAFENATTGAGRPDRSGHGVLFSVALIDDNNGDGDDSDIEPTAGITADEARWDTFFLFQNTTTFLAPAPPASITSR